MVECALQLWSKSAGDQVRMMLIYAKILVVYTVRSKFRVYFECRANRTVVEWICVKTRIKDEFTLLLAAQLEE